MIVNGVNGINTDVVLSNEAVKVLRALLQETTLEQAVTAAQKLQMEGFTLTGAEVMAFANFYVVTLRSIAKATKEPKIPTVEEEPQASTSVN